MYIPKYFKITDDEQIRYIIEKNSFAIMFSAHASKPVATHLPLLLDEENNCLRGHIARGNPQWRELDGQEVLVVFQGPHCYISPSWYETQDTVPTWNYIAVHVYGTFTIIEDNERIQSGLAALVEKYETSDYNLHDVPADYIEDLKKGIVNFEISITSMEGKAKLSQNHSSERRQRVIAALEQIPRENEQNIAAHMKKLQN
ncbi:FMN-binding negative transcriptional regulator [Ectobacillus sp. JY-23]|uniref:FMN-binding negative transcriptional regulator n=1 Tax=Ectobacillus sp. JY-23 TaxID=2933872 RepID=UPI001FF6AE41|nr:FMN-binding negative transcriptional regulator [Ectobacillus sp. JY-23]UOY92493.1 FMN-binding negative transcriptional regulator [Ectobacillus sp. JY-23]